MAATPFAHTCVGSKISSYMTNSLPTCGAVGGMGPIAAIGFLQLVVDLTSNADTDQDHVKIVLEQDGTIPSRNPAIEAVVNVRRRNLDSSHPDAIAAKVLQDEIGLHLAANVKSLADRGVDYVVLLCNTVHFFAPYVHDVLQSYPNVQFLSIIELAADKVMNHYKANPGIGPCAILGQGGCLKSGLYQNALGARGIDFYTLPETEDEMQVSPGARAKRAYLRGHIFACISLFART